MIGRVELFPTVSNERLENEAFRPYVVTAAGQETKYEEYEQTVDLTVEWVDGRGWRVSNATTVSPADA